MPNSNSLPIGTKSNDDSASSGAAMPNGERLVGWLRAELEATTDATRRARLLADIAETEEQAGDRDAAVRTYLASHEADPAFREPIERLASFIERGGGPEAPADVFDSLVDISDTPDQRVHSLVLRGLHRASRQDDPAGGIADLHAACAIDEASPSERARARLTYEILAGRGGDPGARETALGLRSQSAADPTWRGLLLADRAKMAAARGDVDVALSLLSDARAQSSRATWLALQVEQEVLEEHPGIQGTETASARVLRHADVFEAMATLVWNATLDANAGDALGVPRWMRDAARAMDLRLDAAALLRDAGKLEAAAAIVDRSKPILETMAAPDREIARLLVSRASLRLAELARDAGRSAALSEEALVSETDPAIGAAHAVRIADNAIAHGDTNAGLAALGRALSLDPSSIVPRALRLDLLADSDDMAALATELESLAESLESDEARGQTFLLATYAWSALAGDVDGAKAALSQASMFGVSSDVVGRLARTLASLRGDAAWYEEATKRLFATRGAERGSTWLGLELASLRDARGDRDGSDKALLDLRESADGSWPAHVLAAFSPPPGGRNLAVTTGASLEPLASQEPDPAWAATIGFAAAMRWHAGGEIGEARRRLRAIATERPDDLLAGSYLADLDRQAGDPASAAQLAAAMAVATSDPELAAGLSLAAALETWRAGERRQAVNWLETAPPSAHDAAKLALGWARWGTELDDPAARRLALDAAVELDPGTAAWSLERLAVETARGDADAAAAALEHAEAASDGAIAIAGALARLTCPVVRVHAGALRAAVDGIAALSAAGAQIAAVEGLRIAREEGDPAASVRAARSWFEADGGLPAALEWITAAVALGDAREEMQARFAAARCLSGDARAALLASAVLLHPRVEVDQPAPVVPGRAPVLRLANLDLSPPGSDPRRRTAALGALGDTLGEDTEVDSLSLSAWSFLVASDWASAKAAFEGVVAVRPRDVAAWEGIRSCAERAGDTQLLARACSHLGAFCRDASRAASFWERAAAAWSELGDATNVDLALEASFTLDATKAAVFEKLFRRLRDRKQHDKVLHVIARRLEVTDDPNEILKLCWEQARARRETGDQDGALQSLEHVTMLDPNHVGALALLGEINIRRGKFDEAAEALSRLALLDAAPVKSRVTAGVAAVDLYENKLNRIDRSLEVLRSLHQAGISTLPVRERLARAAARAGSWIDATAILEELMHERAEPDGRAAAARLAIAIYRDRLNDLQAAASATVRLLEDIPSDPDGLEVLRQTAQPPEVRARLLGSARTTLVARLQQGPLDVIEVQQLATIARDLEDSALERAALGALACLDASDGDRSRAFARLSAATAHVPEVALSEASLRARLAPGDSGALSDLFGLLGPTLAEALGPNLQACGVGRRDRVDPRSGLSLRSEIASWAGAFGIREMDLYVGGSEPLGVQAIAGDTVAIVVGASVNAPLSPLLRARVARELLAAVRGTSLIRTRDEVAIAAVVAAVCRLVDVAIDHPPYAVLPEMEKLIGKALSRRLRKAVGTLCAAVAAENRDVRVWARRALASQDRFAVVASGDPAVVLSDVTGAPMDALGPTVAASPRAEELVRYVLSQDYLDARAALGLEGPR